ncbi:MAG: hypothetical protein U0V70_09990 [Terriglobia bacterium]
MNTSACLRHEWVHPRREFQKSAFGFGTLPLTYLLESESAFASVFQQATASETNPLAPKSPAFPAKAKSVIFIFLQAGGASHVDN